MKTFLTDSIAVKKKYKDFIFTGSLFAWKISDGNYIKHKTLKRIEAPIVGIVSPSNYRLVFDILHLDKNAIIYKPEDFNFGKRKKMNLSKEKIDKEFDNYMKRSFISYLNYSELRKVGLKRIEQFILLLGIKSFENFLSYDNLLLKKEQKIVEVKKGGVKEEKIKSVSLIPFIYTLFISKKIPIDNILSYLLKAYSELKITDPFEENFRFLVEDSSEIYSVYKELIESKIKVENILVKTEEKQVLRIKRTDSSSLLAEYLFLQREDYFEGKILYPAEEFPNFVLLFNLFKEIIPFKDYILTLSLLIKMRKVQLNKATLKINKELSENIKPKNNRMWISKKIWKDIYDELGYSFGNIISPISCKTIEFNCPVCGSKGYSSTPQKFFCRNYECNFVFYRDNLKTFNVPKLSVEQMIELLKNNSILLKTTKGNNILAELKSEKSRYFPYIK